MWLLFLVVGVIWSQELHSRETPPHYWPTVHESDQGFIEVYTVVQDVSGKAPHTSEHLYYLSVMENTPGGVSIIHIKAFDLHPSSNGEFYFRISAGNPSGFFDINSNTGVVKFTLRKLDAKQQEEHILEVMVTDGSSSAKSSVVQVVIWVLDENEMISTWLFIKVIETNNRRPQFSKAVYKITISANKLPRTEVLQLHTTDKSEKKKLRYILLSSTDPFTLKKFCLDSAKGLLYTAKGLDHDIRHRYSLTVMVHNQDFPAKCNLEGVDITVEDVRDNSFWFSTYTYTGPVFEATAVGSAVDKDRRPHAEILYYTESETMTLMKELDQNSKKQFDFGGKAKDGEQQPLSITTIVWVEVKVSYNAKPRFTEQQVFAEISERTPVGTSVHVIEASSQLAIRYEIKEGNVNNTFNIIPDSGGVVFTQKLLDYEMLPFYKLIIQAADLAGMVSNTILLVHLKDENDNAPIFTQVEFIGKISESTPPNSTILAEDTNPLVIRALDADSDANGRLVYRIVEPSVQNDFAVDSSTGVMRTLSNLDYEQRRFFQFTVQVHDMGTPHLFAQTTACVTIEVIDVNDCSPKFNKDLYETLVVVPTYKGVKVITVSATDGDAGKNSQLIFFISNGNIGNKFQIDPISGVISIQNPTKLLRQYQLTVNVSDGQFTSTVPVIINVKEKPESALRFNQDLYHATVRENSTEIKRLVVISTVDRNTNEPLFYSIVSPEERFQVGLTSGILSTTGIPFDREEQSSIVVVVKVSKGQEATEVAYVRVKITVEDVNDNAPIFVNLPYRALVKMDAAIGQAVRQVIAMDRDAGRNAQVHYRFQEQQEHFQISSSGEISLKKSFNQENLKTKFVVYVVAEDEGEPVLSSIAEVQISVVKKAVPVFEKSFYVVEIPENKQLHTSIVRIQASSFEGPQVVYTITKGDPSCHFSIGFHTGVIEVIQPLDYEMLPIYRLNVKATDSLTGTHASVFVDIILKDINDNSPMFTENVYTVSVSEASVVGTSVLQVLASDSDSGNNKALFYQLVEGSNYDSDFFQIDHKSGVILTTHMLDHEELRQHALKVRVVDGGIPALTADATVVIDVTDVNDNSPVFIQPLYNATVSELAPEDLVVAYVQALDADSSDFGRLEYSILCGNEDHTFEMDVKSGKIFVSSDQVLKMEPVYNLNISVSDGIFYSSVIIRVMVSGANVHSPSFSHADLVVELEENSPIGTFVTQISATDVDPGCYGQVTYFVINDFAKDKFSIRENGDIFTLQSFDRENTIEKIISIRVMAKDGGGKVGFCIIRVILSDINDHAPQFRAAEYKTILTSDVPKQTPVVKMVATDLDAGINADILYKIEANNTNVDKNFEIDPYSGVIVTKKSLIGLEGKLYTFYVRVADAGKPSKMSIAPVYISILGPDVPVPKFSEPHYRFSISEDLPVGTAIGIIQAESELPVIYSLVKSNIVEHKHKESFAIEFDTGVLKLEERVDHEISRWYLFTLQAQSNYKGKEIVSAVDIHIEVKDINDNSPQFDANPYKAFTMENLPGGTMVIQIKATDLDSGVNGHVTYSLDTQQENEDILDLFTIDSKTGWITTLKQLDREKQSSYTLAVAAVDGGEGVRLSATTKVEVTVVDMNDNPPRFTSSVYKVTVREGDSASSGPVAILGTTDVDTEHVNSPLSCYITGGDPGGLFALESSPFEWKVFVKKPLDREERDHYLLNITAIDGTYMAKATIEVKVLDANDNSPVFDKALYAVHVPEDVLSGQIILRVSAADADIGTNAQISYKLLGAGSEDFTINSSTGELKAACSLDREEKGFYRLLVEAMDEGGRLSQADIEITVEDINDNAPQFTSDTFSLTVSEKTEISTPVGRLQAVDLDVGLNGKIVYSLVDSADGWFSVDERSGIICLEKPLNKWVQDVYILVAQANDQGTRQEFSSTCQVTVFVQDVIKNSPVFHRREYTVNIPEDISVGTSILHVFALSRDSKENKIFYSIANDNEHVRFRIDSHTGDIFVTEHLDYEQSQEHFLIVEAANRGTPLLSSPTAITIILTDANDNSPTFSKDTYSTVVSEDVEVGTTLLAVMAEDADGPSNNHIQYSIFSGNQGNAFSIDPMKGEVKVAQPLDREKIPGYMLTVVATDNGNSPKSSSSVISIEVADVNDNPPLFSKANYSFIVQEYQWTGSSVFQLSVMDLDDAHNGPPFTFTIIGGNDKNAFEINQQGVIFTVGQVTHRMNNRYLLNVQVSDSGRPQLFSTTFISIIVAEENMHPPALLPLEVFIATGEGGYPGGVLGKIHVSDRDTYNTLTYSLLSEIPNSAFSLSSIDGRLTAGRGLKVGHYTLSVTVSDGLFSNSANISVHVRNITQKFLNCSIAVRFANLSPEEFIGNHWQDFQRAVISIAGVRKSKIHMVSLQSSQPPGTLDVLFYLEEPSCACSSPQALFHKLNASVKIIQELTGVQVVEVVHKLCAGLHCPLDFCDEVVMLDRAALSTHSTARLTFVTARHQRTAVCVCAGDSCSLLNKLRAIKNCCKQDQGKAAKYNCSCPRNHTNNCRGWPTLTFGGKGYIKHRLLENEIKEVMKLSLRLKTFSSQATIMYFEGTGYNILEILHGRLQYIFDCGDASGVVSVHSLQVNDGKWHSVLLEMNRNYTALTLDQVHSASSTVPGIVCTLSLNHSVFFGGYVKQPGSRLHHVPYVSHGLQGCLAAVVLNGRELPLTSQSEGDLLNIMPGCSVTRPLACQSNPCANGGTCSTLPMGGYFCQCGGFFLGTHCEIDTSACASNPCRYGGTCIPAGNRFYCKCRGQHSGKRCQIRPNCKDNPCKNNGTCIDSRNGPYCQCAHGFHGKRCIEDVDECTMNPCSNGGQCKNTYGSYKCSCSLGFKGRLCELKVEVHSELVSTSWGVGLEKVLGTVGFVVTILVLILMVILAHKKVSGCTKPKFEDHMQSGTSTLMQSPYFDTKISRNMYAVFPSQVPVQPICYTNTTPSGSYCNRHKYFFNPNSVHRHKPVAAHNTVPSMTSPPTSSSPLDSAFIQSLGCGCSYDGKLVPFDLPKKPLQDSSCQLSDTSEHLSEIRSTSSVQPESCDDSGYHWDTSDWMPSAPLPSLVLLSQFEEAKSPLSLHNNPAITKMDYFLGGRGIENDFPPTPDVVSLQDELSSVVDCSNQDNTLQPHQVALYHINELHALSDQRVLYDLYNPQIPNDGQNQHIQQEQHDQRSLHSNHALGD